MASAFKKLIQFCRDVGSGWNRFWFRASDPRLAGKLRIATGLMVLLWFYSISSDLENWFGVRGMVPDATVEAIIESHPKIDDGNQYRWSIFRLTNESTSIWIFHLIAFTASCTFLLGLASTWSAAVCVVALISYTHRAPILFGKAETVLIFAVTYLGIIAASGRHYSLDNHFRHFIRKQRPLSELSLIRTNIGLRLIQSHISIIYLFSALSKLGSEVWWEGDAVWWLAVQPESSMADFTGLASNPLLMNFWTHSIVVLELAMGTLIWIRPLRIVLVGVSTIAWFLMMPLTGEVAYWALMIILNFSFFDKSAEPIDDATSEPPELTELLESRANRDRPIHQPPVDSPIES